MKIFDFEQFLYIQREELGDPLLAARFDTEIWSEDYNI